MTDVCLCYLLTCFKVKLWLHIMKALCIIMLIRRFSFLQAFLAEAMLIMATVIHLGKSGLPSKVTETLHSTDAVTVWSFCVWLSLSHWIALSYLVWLFPVLDSRTYGSRTRTWVSRTRTCEVLEDKDFPRGQQHWVTVKNGLLADIPPILHLASSEQWCWSGERGILTELSLCYSIV